MRLTGHTPDKIFLRKAAKKAKPAKKIHYATLCLRVFMVQKAAKYATKMLKTELCSLCRLYF